MRNGVFWLSMVVTVVSLVVINLGSQPRAAEAVPSDICKMIAWDSTGRVLNDGDIVGGDGRIFVLARVEDNAFGFIGDFLSEPGAALDLLEEVFADLEAEIAEIDVRLAEIEIELEAPGLTDLERADLENEKAVLEADKFALEEVKRELEDAIKRFRDFNLAQVDAKTGSARIRSYAEVAGFEFVKPRVYHRLIPHPGVASQKIDHMFPDFFTDPDGHDLDSIRAWLAQVAGVPVPSAVSDAASVCGNPNVADGWKFVDLVCFQAGSFNFTISHHGFLSSSENTARTIYLICPGQAETATLAASRTTVETQPTNVAPSGFGQSVITVTVLDQFRNRIDGIPVTFLTNNCQFRNQGPAYAGVPGIGAGSITSITPISPVEGGMTVVGTTDTEATGPDQNFLTDNPLQHSAGTAEVVLDCTLPGSTPGTAVVTAIVERPGANIVLTQTITVIGPTAPTGLTLTLSPTSLECGEVVRATARAVDATGAAVSPGTTIYFTTDTSSGVVGGLPAGGAQGVSTTINGEAVAHIATDPSKPGIHTVIAYVVNNAGTPSAQVAAHYTCEGSVAAIVPTVPAPSTGTGSITPPSTGDAGLATTSGGASSVWPIGAGALIVLLGLSGLVASWRRQALS